MTEKTRKAFHSWLAPIEPNYHPLDDERFFSFAETCYSEKDEITKEEFVKYAKSLHPTTNKHHRGMYQEYYDKLVVIVQFLKWKNRK